jgi:hypothetical protein
MSDEKRWTISKQTNSLPRAIASNQPARVLVEGPDTEAIEVIPVEAAESKLAEVEGKLAAADERIGKEREFAGREAGRADKAEADLARVREALEQIADGEVPNVEFAEDDLIAEFARDALASPAREQLRYTVDELFDALAAEGAAHAAWEWATARSRRATAFPQPNTPTEESDA